MNLDNLEKFTKIDSEEMVSKIRNLPDMILAGWRFSAQQNAIKIKQPDQIIFSGFETERNIIRIFRTILNLYISAPLKFYDLAELADKKMRDNQLIVLNSDEENLDNLKKLIIQVGDANHKLFVITANEKLRTELAKMPLEAWHTNELTFQRNSIGYDLGLLSGLFHKAGLLPDISKDIDATVKALKTNLLRLDIDISSIQNPAKRLAGQMVGRWIKIISGKSMFPIAQYWSEQISKCAKVVSFSEEVSDLAHFSLSGNLNPAALAQQSMNIFIHSMLDSEKEQILLNLTRDELMCIGVGTDTFSARGESHLLQIFNSILFGEFLAYYLAIAYECDPTPILSVSPPMTQ